MSVREYIGARYVPYFDGTWSIEKNYEPLTVVESNGNSYTSRQYVPAGTLLTNNQYWAQTGNYNAQVEQYRAEVRTYSDRLDQNSEAIATETAARIAADQSMQTTINGFDSRITTNQNAIAAETTAREAAITDVAADIAAETTAREAAIADVAADVTALEGNVYTKTESDDRYVQRAGATDDLMVCIGDSLLSGWSNENPNGIPAWDSYLASALGYDSANVYSKEAGGAGFASGTTFNTMVASARTDILNAGKDPANVRLVVCAGGVNDLRNNVGHTPMQNGAANFVSAARQAFPNAMIHLFPMLMGNIGVNRAMFELIRDVFAGAQTLSPSHFKYVVIHDGVWSWNYDGNDSGVSSDHIHLLAGGEKLAGLSMATEINGGSAYNEGRPFRIDDINGVDIAYGCRNGAVVSFALATNVSSSGANNICLGVDRRYANRDGSISFSNETETGTRIFFYNWNDGTFNSYMPLSNAGCYGTVSYVIESSI